MDVCLTQCSPRESYSSNWFQHFCALPRNRYKIWRLSVLRYTTQLSYTFHNSNCTFAFIFLRLFVWLFFQPSSAEMSTQRRTYIPISFKRTDIREDANTRKAIWCKYLSRSIYTAVDRIYQTGFCLWHFFFSTHFYLVFLKIVAHKVVRLSVSALHDRYSHAGNYIGLTLPLFFRK